MPERAGEARRERAEALQPDREADLGDRAVGVAQQRGRALEPAGQQVGVRDSPNARRNSRLKCARDRPAARARSSTPAARSSARRRGPWRAADGGREGRRPSPQSRRGKIWTPNERAGDRRSVSSTRSGPRPRALEGAAVNSIRKRLTYAISWPRPLRCSWRSAAPPRSPPEASAATASAPRQLKPGRGDRGEARERRGHPGQRQPPPRRR